MVLYLPIVSGVLFGGSLLSTTVTVTVSLLVVIGVLGAAYVFGDRLSAIALSQSSEALLLTLLGGTLLFAGIAGRLNLSTAVGAFVVGVALSGDIVSHARGLLLPLRNLFAAVFCVFGLAVDITPPPDSPSASGHRVVTIPTRLHRLVGAVTDRQARPGRAGPPSSPGEF